ncbi:MAG: DUF1559 domain-containing protein, partial [Planctomycetaceae bacterium]
AYTAGTVVKQAVTSYAGCSGGFNGSQNGDDPRRSDGVFYSNWGGSPANQKVRIRDITDGTSNTFILAEHAARSSEIDEGLDNGSTSTGLVARHRWYGSMQEGAVAGGGENRLVVEGQRQINPPLSLSVGNRRRTASSEHPGGALFALADGSVRFISENIENTGRNWNAADPYDSANGGKGFGTQQRLFSRSDGLVIGEF